MSNCIVLWVCFSEFWTHYLALVCLNHRTNLLINGVIWYRLFRELNGTQMKWSKGLSDFRTIIFVLGLKLKSRSSWTIWFNILNPIAVFAIGWIGLPKISCQFYIFPCSMLVLSNFTWFNSFVQRSLKCKQQLDEAKTKGWWFHVDVHWSLAE